jgi:NADPH2:quinone reductase
MRKRLTITGSTLRIRPITFKGAIAQNLLHHVWPLCASGKIHPIVHAVLPAADAAQAHAMMEASHHVGKIVLTWDAL